MNSIKIGEITISLVSRKYPRKLIRHLRERRHFKVEKVEEGIYYVIGDKIPIQIIVTKELSSKENLWLRSLTNDLKKTEDAEELIRDYQKHSKSRLYQSIMNIIMQANKGKFKEAKKMCEALRELMKEEIEEELNIKKLEGEEIGEHNKLLELVEKKLMRGKTAEEIADALEEDVDVIIALMEEVREREAV